MKFKKLYVIAGVAFLAALLLYSFLRNKNSAPSKSLPGLNTDTGKSSIDQSKIVSGGPGKDGIPAISNPKFVDIGDEELSDSTSGILINLNKQTRFYPFNILVWHEIVNDSIEGSYIAVTFCPLCGSAIVFDRRVGDEILEFGVSGLLYESNLLMYDKKTESLWSQVLGEAVVGSYTGTKLAL